MKGDKLINEFGIFKATNNKKVINFKSFFALKKLNSSSKLIKMIIESITITTVSKLFINSLIIYLLIELKFSIITFYFLFLKNNLTKSNLLKVKKMVRDTIKN